MWPTTSSPGLRLGLMSGCHDITFAWALTSASTSAGSTRASRRCVANAAEALGQRGEQLQVAEAHAARREGSRAQ